MNKLIITQQFPITHNYFAKCDMANNELCGWVDLSQMKWAEIYNFQSSWCKRGRKKLHNLTSLPVIHDKQHEKMNKILPFVSSFILDYSYFFDCNKNLKGDSCQCLNLGFDWHHGRHPPVLLVTAEIYVPTSLAFE